MGRSDMRQLANLLPAGLTKAVPFTYLCQVHGRVAGAVFDTDGTPGKCPACVVSDDRDATLRKAADDRLAHLLRISGIPPRYAEASFRGFEPPTDNAAAVRDALGRFTAEVIRGSREWSPVLVTGTRGTGKTHLLCAVVRNLAQRGVSAHYTTTRDMLADIRRAYSTADMTEASQVYRYVMGFDLLVIDEVDVMRDTDNDFLLLWDVINGRYNERRTVVVASNKSPEGLETVLTDRLMDRLRENGLVLRCDWPSRRATA